MTRRPAVRSEPALLCADPRWLFGKRADIWAFGGSAVASLALVALGAALGILQQPTPTWVWILCVLGLDVAHVWSTLFRVYLDKASFLERPRLYVGAPLVAWLAGTIVHQHSSALFWRLLAYFAVFHFVRQQYGWLRLYQKRLPTSRWDVRLERLVIYSATLFPLFWWHTRIPRGFTWFMEGDFVELLATPSLQRVASYAEVAYWLTLLVFAARQVQLARVGSPIPWGKIQLIGSTWLCWWLGIIALNSDYAFTVTNVIIHAIPYFVLTYRYADVSRRTRQNAKHHRLDAIHPTLLRPAGRFSVVLFLLPLIALAFVEEGLWDRWIWLEQSELFGEGSEVSSAAKHWLVPLLALPQLTHYLLDGVIWRATPKNARFLAMVRQHPERV